MLTAYVIELDEPVKPLDLSEGRVAKKLVQIFKNGRSRAVRIPKEFEFAADSVVMRRQPDGSIVIMTATTAGLTDYLRIAESWEGGNFIKSDDDLAPLGEVRFP